MGNRTKPRSSVLVKISDGFLYSLNTLTWQIDMLMFILGDDESDSGGL